MLSTDPSYDNRTLKMQIWIAMNNRDVSRVMKTMFPAMVMVFSVVSSAEECGDPLVQSGGRWQTLSVSTGLGAGPQVQRDPGLALYPSLTAPLPRPEPAGLLCLVIHREHHQHDLPQHQASLIAAICRVFAELPPALVEKAYSQFRIRIEAVIEAEGGYIE